MPGGERHFETGQGYGKKEPSVLMPKKDGERDESCPPVANGPVTNSIHGPVCRSVKQANQSFTF